MAKLLVTDQFLLESLFPGESVRINGIRAASPTLYELDIEGLTVPDCEFVMCEVRVARKSFSFKEVKR